MTVRSKQPEYVITLDVMEKIADFIVKNNKGGWTILDDLQIIKSRPTSASEPAEWDISTDLGKIKGTLLKTVGNIESVQIQIGRIKDKTPRQNLKEKPFLIITKDQWTRLCRYMASCGTCSHDKLQKWYDELLSERAE
jgi:hypothetical protein